MVIRYYIISTRDTVRICIAVFNYKFAYDIDSTISFVFLITSFYVHIFVIFLIFVHNPLHLEIPDSSKIT